MKNIKEYEVVEYRNCDCSNEQCPGEKETVLFQHKAKEECMRFMLLESVKPNIHKIREYENKDKIDLFFYFGKREGIKRLRVQKT